MADRSAARLLDAWDWGQGVHSVDRALRLVAVARPEVPSGQLAEMGLGECNDSLLALHQQFFGDGLPCAADCPACTERVEFDLSAADLRRETSAAGFAEVVFGAQTLRIRQLNSHDLAAVVEVATPGEARLLLAQRCVLDPVDVDLSEELVQALAEQLAVMDQCAEALVDLTCPGCGCAWQRALDVAAYVWREISAEALRLLHEVHTLARAYGWSEADILALSASRRRAYVELAG
jgi:hypothetical protein